MPFVVGFEWRLDKMVCCQMVVLIRDGVGKVHRGCVFGGYSRLFYSQGTANGNFRFYTNQAHTGKALWCLPKVFWWTRILVESAPQLVSKIKFVWRTSWTWTPTPNRELKPSVWCQTQRHLQIIRSHPLLICLIYRQCA